MAVQEFSYPARIVAPGRTYETRLVTIAGKRTVQETWTPDDGELVMFELELVGDLDADVVTYSVTASFDLRPDGI